MLAILSTHPIQYQVPLWQMLARDTSVPFEVWYLSDHATLPSFDSEFKENFAWDINMLSGYPSRFLRTNSNHDVARFGRLRLSEPINKRLKSQNVKALWIQGWQVAAYWQSVWQAHSAGVPVWLRGESNDLAMTPSWKKMVKSVALRQLFSRVDDFLYIGKANRRLYESYGVQPSQLHPAHYCVDNKRFAEQASMLRSERRAIRNSWGIPDSGSCVLFAGKLIPKKRPLDVITATSYLQSQGFSKSMHILFAGSGELSVELKQACNVVFEDGRELRPLNLESGKPNASFVGFLNQTEISKAYVAADLLVLPSDHRETWGLVVNEALASGLTCAVSASCGSSEDLIAPLNPELTFKAGDISQLANSIRQGLNQPFSQKQIDSILETFSPQKSLESIAKLYAAALTN